MDIDFNDRLLVSLTNNGLSKLSKMDDYFKQIMIFFFFFSFRNFKFAHNIIYLECESFRLDHLNLKKNGLHPFSLEKC